MIIIDTQPQIPKGNTASYSLLSLRLPNPHSQGRHGGGFFLCPNVV